MNSRFLLWLDNVTSKVRNSLLFAVHNMCPQDRVFLTSVCTAVHIFLYTLLSVLTSPFFNSSKSCHLFSEVFLAMELESIIHVIQFCGYYSVLLLLIILHYSSGWMDSEVPWKCWFLLNVQKRLSLTLSTGYVCSTGMFAFTAMTKVVTSVYFTFGVTTVMQITPSVFQFCCLSLNF